MIGDIFMKKKSIFIVLIIWLLVFLVDIICAFTISKPVFMLETVGGEMTNYYGLGYSMTHLYENTPDGYRDGGFEVNPVLYLVTNGFIIILLLRHKKRTE